MKFQLIIEANEKRLVLIPENAGEANLLSALADPNGLNRDNDFGEEKAASVRVKPTNDRVPYRKVQELHVVFT